MVRKRVPRIEPHIDTVARLETSTIVGLDPEEMIPIFITIFHSTWMTTKIDGVATDLFCTGVIGHQEYVFVN